MMHLNSPVWVAAVQRAESAPLDLGSPAGGGPGGGSLVRTIVGLAIVLGVIYGLHWALKQAKSRRSGRAAGQGLTALATLPLGANRSLHVVRAGREVLVVGSGEQGVTPVRTYSEAEARALGIIGADEDDEADSVIEVVPRRALPAARRAVDTLRAWTVRG